MEPKLEAKVENLAMIRIPTHVYEDHLIGRYLCSPRGPNCDLGSWFPTLSFLSSLLGCLVCFWCKCRLSASYTLLIPHACVYNYQGGNFLLSTMY